MWLIRRCGSLNKIIKHGLTALLVTGMGILFTSFSAQSTYQQAYASTASSFISQYKSDVTKAATKYNLYGSVMMAQAGLESGWGQSQLTQEANNFFGIKGAYNGASVSMPTVEYNSNGQMINTTANFKNIPPLTLLLPITDRHLGTGPVGILSTTQVHGKKTRLLIKMLPML